MKLKLKKEYLEWGFLGTGKKKVKLKNIPESEWISLYEGGYTEFFDVEVSKPKKEEKLSQIELKIENNDDTDNGGTN